MLLELCGVSVDTCLLSPRHMQPREKKFLKSEPCGLHIDSPGWWWQSPIDRVEPGSTLETLGRRVPCWEEGRAEIL